MRLIGITGGIASGKSLVVRSLARRGAVTFSADEAARAILTPQGRVLDAIVEAFGTDILLPNKALDRGLLAKQIFQTPQLRHKLDSITHPPILYLLSTQIESARYELSPQTTVCVEMPLLYEVGLEHWFETILVVYATPEEQIARLSQRSKITPEEAKRRLSAQMPLEEKRRRADIVIENHGTLSELEKQLQRLWNQLQSQKER